HAQVDRGRYVPAETPRRSSDRSSQGGMMVRRASPAAAVGAGIVLAAVLVATAAAHAAKNGSSPAAASSPSAALVSCKSAQIAIMGPFTGPAASIGQEQLKFAKYALASFNKQNRTNYKLVESDTQLDAKQASTRAVQLASNKNVLGVVGPAGSQEVQAVAKTFRGMAYISPSATNTTLTIGAKRIKTFWRVVGNDVTQAATDARFIKNDLKAKQVYIIDDQTSYSVPLANGVSSNLKAGGVSVSRDSVSQQVSDFSSLVTKVGSDVDVVFLPWQLAAKAQLFYQQLREQGKKAVIVGSDGLDSGDFLGANGSYFSAFAPDLHGTKDKAARAILSGYAKKYGAFKSNFGPPSYVALQVMYVAVKAACADGVATRAEVLKKMQATNLKATLLGFPMRFNLNHDPLAGKFFLFKVVNGKPQFIR
ncbi:MAG: branched-chain amino acid ABC transporter substrate-binding protein, partial [Actinobacteria bacterium]|nr:branched-chain amino acid ABC transporter substrate-binding protein [Actinomycetota bacterium]